MTDLSTSVAGLRLKNPIVCASGEATMSGGALRAAIDAGAAAVVAKSTNESEAAKAQLASARAVALGPGFEEVEGDVPGGSLLNRSGLVDVPFDEWLETLAEADAYARGHDAYVLGSLIVADLERAVEMAAAMEGAGLRAIELNLSAPHGEEAAPGAIETVRESARVAEVVGRVAGAVSIPVLAKLTGESADVGALVRAAVDAGAGACVVMGRQLAFLPDPATRRPLLGTFGAIGGGWALPLTLRHVARARARLGPEVDLVATNGVRSAADVVRCLLAGARAVEIYTLVHLHGFGRVELLLDGLRRYAAEQGLESLEELIGEAADNTLTYAEAAGSGRSPGGAPT